MTKKNKISLILFTLIIISGLTLRGAFMAEKKNWHVDEAISFSLVNDQWPIQMNTSYKDRWIDGQELQYILFDANVEEKPFTTLIPAISLQTAQDVHPPLYYWLLLLFRKVLGAENRVLAGFALNLLCYILSALLMLGIAKQLRLTPFMTGVVLLCHALARGGISMTLFIRMYELLQLWVLLLIHGTLALLQGHKMRFSTLILPLLELFLSIYAGLLTHYYLLFVLIPVSLFALVYFIKERSLRVLGYSVLGSFLACLLAFRTFPPALYHLFGSYRATESATSLLSLAFTERAWRLVEYLRIVSRDLFSIPLAVSLLIIGVLLTRPWKHKEGEKQAPLGSVFFGLISLFIIIIISFSAPYRTGRYVSAFLPLFILAMASFLTFLVRGNADLAIKGKKLSVPLGALLMTVLPLAMIFTGLAHPGMNEFHEDYRIDADPYYLQDAAPLILFSSTDAWNWKNMLIYGNLGTADDSGGVRKKLYIMDRDLGFWYESLVKKIAREEGAPIAYLAVDDYFRRIPSFEKIGFYGFFNIHAIQDRE